MAVMNLLTPADLGINDSDDLKRYCDMKVKAYRAEMIELGVFWPDLRKRLRQVPSLRGGVFGYTDPILIANRISKHGQNAEKAAEAASLSFKQLWFDYLELIKNPHDSGTRQGWKV